TVGRPQLLHKSFFCKPLGRQKVEVCQIHECLGPGRAADRRRGKPGGARPDLGDSRARLGDAGRVSAPKPRGPPTVANPGGTPGRSGVRWGRYEGHGPMTPGRKVPVRFLLILPPLAFDPPKDPAEKHNGYGTGGWTVRTGRRGGAGGCLAGRPGA